MKLTKRIFLAPLLLLLACNSTPEKKSPLEIDDGEFQRLALELSETPGFFDTDNLISNESSYLHVVPGLERIVRKGGVYLGVGPDQNFSYIAVTRPSLAFMIDIRRDNLLEHLYFKGIFEKSKDRWEYLSILLGKPLPPELERDPESSARELMRTFRTLNPDPVFFEAHVGEIWKDLRERFPELTQESDKDSIWHIALSFFREQFELKFRSHGRPPRVFYPNFGELIVATDLNGKEHNYLASDVGYETVRELQEENRIIPIVGNLAGDVALERVGEYLKSKGLTVAAFYVSNVEFYLYQDRSFRYFIRNLGRLPYDHDSVLIRSYFSYWRRPHPETVPGHAVVSLLHRISDLLKTYSENPFIGYRDLLFHHYEQNATEPEETLH